MPKPDTLSDPVDRVARHLESALRGDKALMDEPLMRRGTRLRQKMAGEAPLGHSGLTRQLTDCERPVQVVLRQIQHWCESVRRVRLQRIGDVLGPRLPRGAEGCNRFATRLAISAPKSFESHHWTDFAPLMFREKAHDEHPVVVLQILAGLPYGASGVMKVFMFDKVSHDVPSFGAMPREAWIAIGMLELLCTVGLIVPATFHWRPALTVVTPRS